MKNSYLDTLRSYIPATRLLLNESMSRHTSFKTGGPCDVMVLASSVEDIIHVMTTAKEYGEKLYVLGNCTNVIVTDKGIRGTVLKIAKDFDQVIVTGNEITATAGTLLSTLAKKAQMAGLSGLEFAAGIPGTIGGGVSMNAGAYGGDISQVLKKTIYIDSSGRKKSLSNSEHDFSYRKSFFSQSNHVIVKSTFALKTDDKDQILARMNELNKKRRDKQPINLPSAGSVFKRPLGYFTGQLIEQCQLKGYEINGAMVSTLHAGFIVNNKKATSKDIIDLITHIQDTVYGTYQVRLETEVKIVGEK